MDRLKALRAKSTPRSRAPVRPHPVGRHRWSPTAAPSPHRPHRPPEMAGAVRRPRRSAQRHCALHAKPAPRWLCRPAARWTAVRAQEPRRPARHLATPNSRHSVPPPTTTRQQPIGAPRLSAPETRSDQSAPGAGKRALLSCAHYDPALSRTCGHKGDPLSGASGHRNALATTESELRPEAFFWEFLF